MINKFNPQKIKSLKKINMFLSIFFREKKADTNPEISWAKSILIIDPTLIGDIVMLTPFLRIIKKNTSNARITLVCGKWAEQILRDQDLVDQFIFVDSRLLNSPKEMILKWGEVRKVIKEINRTQYDFALEPRGDLRYIFFMHFCNAVRKISYSYTGGECFLTDVIPPSDKVEHLVEDKLFFAEQIGCKYSEEDKYPKLTLTKEQKKENALFKEKNHLVGKRIIGIHPGASMAIKQWDGFGELLVKLNSACSNLFFMIFEGPNEENAVQKVVDQAEKCGAEYLVSRTGIGEYMQRIALCDAVICNDSGAGHLAAAYGVPVYVVFGPVLPELAKPYAKKNVYIFSNKELKCKPCMTTVCQKNKECINTISAMSVWRKIQYDFFREYE